MLKRYVDDILVTSRCVCDECLRTLQRIVYDGVLVFDEDFDAAQQIGRTKSMKMLEMFIVWDGSKPTFFQHVKNLSMLVSESLALRKQFKFPVFLVFGSMSRFGSSVRNLVADALDGPN